MSPCWSVSLKLYDRVYVSIHVILLGEQPHNVLFFMHVNIHLKLSECKQ